MPPPGCSCSYRDLRSSKIDQVSFKRSLKDLEDPSQDERPLKKKKFEQGLMVRVQCLHNTVVKLTSYDCV
jgi:hypothetical protein